MIDSAAYLAELASCTHTSYIETTELLDIAAALAIPAFVLVTAAAALGCWLYDELSMAVWKLRGRPGLAP